MGDGRLAIRPSYRGMARLQDIMELAGELEKGSYEKLVTNAFGRGDPPIQSGS